MWPHFVSVFLCVLTILVSSTEGTSKALFPYEDQDAYDVYSALLPREADVWSNSKVLLILEQTVRQTKPIQEEECFQVTPNFLNTYADLLSDYNDKNGHTWTLEEKLHIAKPYHLFSTGLGHGAPPDYKAVQKQFPGAVGYMAMSAVGFNKDRTTAMVEMAHYCGNLCGGRDTHFLRITKHGWIEFRPEGVSNACGWIS